MTEPEIRMTITESAVPLDPQLRKALGERGINFTVIPFEGLAIKAIEFGMTIRETMSQENRNRWDDFFLDCMEWLFKRNKDREVQP